MVDNCQGKFAIYLKSNAEVYQTKYYEYKIISQLSGFWFFIFFIEWIFFIINPITTYQSFFRQNLLLTDPWPRFRQIQQTCVFQENTNTFTRHKKTRAIAIRTVRHTQHLTLRMRAVDWPPIGGGAGGIVTCWSVGSRRFWGPRGRPQKPGILLRFAGL